MACETDGMNSTDTPGYFGHLELAKPVFHHGFIKNVVSVLRCVGFSSSKLMIDKVRAVQRHALVDLYQPPNVFQTGSHRFFVDPDRPRDHGGGAFTGRRVGSTWVDARST